MPNYYTRGERMEDRRIEFLIEGYKVATSYYDGFMNRIWNRFNIMVTLDSALLALFLTLWFGSASSKDEFLIVFPFVGFVFSMLMYAQSAQDRFVSHEYFLQINDLKEMIASQLDLGSGADLPMLFSRTPTLQGERKSYYYREIVSWRIRRFSLTRIPAWASLLFVMVWVLLGILTLAG
jgi:hypothetical protein